MFATRSSEISTETAVTINGASFLSQNTAVDGLWNRAARSSRGRIHKILRGTAPTARSDLDNQRSSRDTMP